MAREKLQMIVKEITDHTPTVRELVVHSPKPFNFKAGQFVMLHFDHEGKEEKRAYSIASTAKSEEGFRLLFKYVDQGKASQYVWKMEGETPVEFTGPFGKSLL